MTLDTQLFYSLHSLAGLSPLGDSIIVFLASTLAYIVIGVFLGLVIFSAYSRREKWEIFLVAILSGLIARFGVAEIIRYFYHRPRPFLTLPIHPLFTDSAWSFPSGHAMFFFAMSTAIYLHNKRWGRWFFAAAAVITVSRVIAGVHYPLDIVGGSIIGSALAYLINAPMRRLLKKAHF